MTIAERADLRHSRCQQQMSRLRVLAMSEDSLVPSGQFAIEVREATNAVIAYVEAASRVVLDVEQHEPGTETFLWVRVARLALAADEAFNAARSGDLPALRAHLRHFETLTSAIWTVRNAMYGPDANFGRPSP